VIDASKLKTGPSSFKDEDLDRKLRKEALERLQAMTLDFEGIVFPGLGIEPWQWTGDQVQAECPDPGAVHERGGAWGFHTGKMLHSCFGCGYSGDIIGLAQDLLGMEDWKEAYLWLAEGGGRRPDETREAYIDRLVQSATDRTEEEPEPMPDYPPEMLAQYGEIHESVFERGISQGVADRMQLGFDRSHMATTLPHFFDGKLVGIQYRHLAQNAAGHYLCPRPSA